MAESCTSGLNPYSFPAHIVKRSNGTAAKLTVFDTFRAGFPAGCNDPDPPLPIRCSSTGFAKLVKEREALLHKPLSQYRRDQIEMARTYLLEGAPFLLDESKLKMEPGVHRFEDKEDQALCLDSLAGFAQAGFLAGPLSLDAVDAPKLVGAFTREQESSQKKRCISDLSQPRGEDGGSFNSALGRGPVLDWPMVEPGTIQAAVLLVWQHGPGAVMTKADISNAYKVS